MATLEGQKICDSYKDLLQVSNSGAGLDGTLRSIESGAGTLSACQLSTNYLKIGDTGVPCTIELAPGSTAIGFPENTGPQGDIGAQGTAGGTGAQGNAGAQGPAGTGAQGAQGTAGSAGGTGSQGSAGAQGTAGAQGAQGSGASITLGTTAGTIKRISTVVPGNDQGGNTISTILSIDGSGNAGLAGAAVTTTAVLIAAQQATNADGDNIFTNIPIASYAKGVNMAQPIYSLGTKVYGRGSAWIYGWIYDNQLYFAYSSTVSGSPGGITTNNYIIAVG